ncbi:MAG: 30S ribosomal protein S16, partial [Berkelbacteria bacterium GW2011_GWA1_39_10]
MLAIRLRRTGKKGQPSYRIVVTDERASVYGKYIEMIGHYNPQTKAVVLDSAKALDWMKKGAKPSNTVAKLMQK